MDRVLVTGGSGYIALYCMLALFKAGYRVRATVRSLKREPEVRAMLKQGRAEPGERLELVEADLMADAGWAEAAAGCRYMLHVASPLIVPEPEDEELLIRPAREGALRALKAARDAGVERVVLTSSFAAVGYGHEPPASIYDEANWTNLDNAKGAYIRSKTMAEAAAWEFIEREGQGLELATVNPVIVLGPALGQDSSPSLDLVRFMLEGKLKLLPNLMNGIVDVRDVADLHLRAMLDPAAKGQRFLAVSGEFLTFKQIAGTLEQLGAPAGLVSTKVAPDWAVRLAATVSPIAKQASGPELGLYRTATAEKAQRVLGWKPRPPQESILDTARSLLELGLVSQAG